MKTTIFVLLFVLFFTLSNSSVSAQDTSLDDGAEVTVIGTIYMEAPEPSDEDWTDIFSFEHQKAGKNDKSEWMKVRFKKPEKMPRADLSGTKIPRILIFDNSSGGDYVRYELKNVVVMSHSVVDKADTVVVICKLKYGEIRITQTDSNEAGETTSTLKYRWTSKEGTVYSARAATGR